MGSRRTRFALRRRAVIALTVWGIALALLAAVAAIPEGPLAVLSVDDTRPAVGEIVRFNASGSASHDAGNGRIAAFHFVFGDGQESVWQESSTATHAYASEGTFTASVTVVDLRGLTGTASVTLRVGTSAPPPGVPDLLPTGIILDPAQPQVNDTVALTVVVLNRGGGNATSATVAAYDVRPDGRTAFLTVVPIPQELAPSRSVPVKFPSFLAEQAGNHTIRAVVANVTPTPASSQPQELDLLIVIRTSGSQPGPGAKAFDVGPLAIVLSAAAVTAMAGAGYLLLRRPPKGPLEPPSAQPPDRTPPPIWPP